MSFTEGESSIHKNGFCSIKKGRVMGHKGVSGGIMGLQNNRPSG